ALVKGERSECTLPLTRKPSKGYLNYLTFMLPMFEITTIWDDGHEAMMERGKLTHRSWVTTLRTIYLESME
ncbi:MAG: hypothetical protein JRI34_12710, partial [Deltaproteobacteria bacterium]|nr:hypothetical protein [Deltaproteobacteria bacterium]